MEARAAVVTATQDELIENGYDALSAEAVARRAGVPADDVLDQWPDAEALVALVFEELGEHELVLLNTGSLETDLRALAAGILAFHGVPRLRETFKALVYSAGRSQGAAESLRQFWEQRLARAAEPVTSAIAAGDLPADTDPIEVIRMLGAPFYYRMFVTLEPLDDALAERAAAAALAAARAGVLTAAR
jgi:AcrR family transcriptional regulator